MARRYPVKITVIKKLSAKRFMDTLAGGGWTIFRLMRSSGSGQEFMVEESGAMPPGFCTWAWHDLYPAVTGLRFGGNYPWMKKEGMIYSCCSDGARPVFFKIERMQ
jgi:uncharacterized repeat protein (TIGR04076 family)